MMLVIILQYGPHHINWRRPQTAWWETICMKCQILFSGKNKNNIINLLSAEFAQVKCSSDLALEELINVLL